MVNANGIDLDAIIERQVKQQEYNKTRNQDPEVKAKQKAYQERRKNDPVVKLKQRISNKKKSAENKYAKLLLSGNMTPDEAKEAIAAEHNALEKEFASEMKKLGTDVPAVVDSSEEE